MKVIVDVLPHAKRSDDMQAALVLSLVGTKLFHGAREGELRDGGEVVGTFTVEEPGARG